MRFIRPILLAAAVLFAGTALAQDMQVFKLVARDGKFDPAVLEVPAGKRFRVEISNENRKAIEFESKDLKHEKVIAPGAKATVTINALKAGEYKFFDEFNEATGQGKIVAK
jgi:uncharacterized cupredoxin-like copper-binding protein